MVGRSVSLRVVAAVAYKSFAEIPGPATFPFLGTPTTIKFSRKSIEAYHDDLLRMYRQYGPVFKETYPLGFGSVVHVFSPDDARTTFASDGRWPYIVPLQSTTQKYRQLRGMNPGLGNLNGEEWYRLRAAVQQAMMRPEAVQEYLPFVNEVADRLVAHISECADENREVDMKIIAGRWSLESAGLIVFEKRLGALTNRIAWADKLVNLNKEVFQLSANMRFSPPFYKYFATPNWRKMVKLEDQFYWEVDKLSTEAIAKLTSKDGDENKIKFASKLINKPTLQETDIKTILLSLFSDGLSTTAPMLVYNLYLLAKNPTQQAKLREELTAVAKPGEKWTPERLNRVPYLRACIKEGFRMFTITTEISRIPQQDIVLGGYHIPALTPIEIHTSLLGRDPKHFSDPEEYNPSRWLRGSAEKKEAHPFVQTPFGHGPRMCAGRRFADQDLLVVIARLVSAYEIRHHHGDLRQVYQTLIMPDGDLRFQFTPVTS